VGVISCRIFACCFPLPLVPSRRGRGKFTFYEIVINGRLEYWNTETIEKKLKKMNIGFVRLKIDGFPNIPSFQHSIIPKDVHPSFQHSTIPLFSGGGNGQPTSVG
jgi:hypothetical protein